MPTFLQALPPYGINRSWFHADISKVLMNVLSQPFSVECDAGQWEGEDCKGVWVYSQFWGFAALLLISTTAMNIGISVTDAIIVDTIGMYDKQNLQPGQSAMKCIMRIKAVH